MHQVQKNHKSWVIAGTVFAIVGAILFFRAFYGMDTTDETFYLATAKRFHDGDLLFRNDWNSAQTFGLLLVPFYRLYVSVVGNNEGIILCMRSCFVILAVFVAGFTYKVLYRYTKIFSASLWAALCILVYARGNIITCSYYSLGFYSFLLSILWWMDAGEEGKKRWKLLLSGISFSISVLCMPYMAVLFPIILFVGIYKKHKKRDILFSKVLIFSVGVAFSALIFLIYFVSVIPWLELMELLPFIFCDPGMESENILEQLFSLAKYFVATFMKFTWPIYLFTFSIIILIRLKKLNNIYVLKIIPYVLLIEFLVQLIYVRGYFEGGIITTTFLYMLQMQILYFDIREKELEKYFIIPGLLFGVVWVAGSNVDQRVINMAFLLMNLWAIPLLWKFKRGKKYEIICMRCPVCIMFLVLFMIRILDIYRDGALTQLNTKVETGIMKGIYTEQDRAQAYTNVVDMLRRYTDEKDTIVTVGCDPWIYLETEASCGAYTVWQVSDGDNLLRKYYEMNPDKIPNVVVHVSDLVNTYEFWRFSSHGVGLYEGEQLELYGILKEIVENGDYKKIEEEGTILYKAAEHTTLVK